MLHIRNNHLLQSILLGYMQGIAEGDGLRLMQRNSFASTSMLEAANRRSLSVEYSGASSGRMSRG
jgi:hypothetical protein